MKISLVRGTEERLRFLTFLIVLRDGAFHVWVSRFSFGLEKWRSFPLPDPRGWEGRGGGGKRNLRKYNKTIFRALCALIMLKEP